ncbi:hypothetical protein [Egicoccus halophilus]|uniref:Uncharacterized protein n=1 Tax=Egicoccus halophilus TaxID=1670830 RepID=A0A8J3AEP8_9ACTN|nr:hypothetical protein [Egicoccus halophilus]GGI07207.1 hypothetical protein GCM10011354_22930 [Egicoccus halophilus]
MSLSRPHVPGSAEPRAAHADARDTAGCVACGAPLETPGCCSLDCVRAARRELEDNVGRLRRLQWRDVPSETRARLTERNGRLTAALLGWRN